MATLLTAVMIFTSLGIGQWGIQAAYGAETLSGSGTASDLIKSPVQRI